ncbi:PEP-CTERM sorting domain-containing protein [Geomonas sp. RF6]|uniref:PEP-CTERM sorting domain-containing protein n=1 Tax=Geomonas sp. RF6 TaxID=2897342 RepID=UPI001E35EB16|nr:PEP-CTERM sorting domain-containing protein [Geomonas sp. RF6]UFS69950.1 PEP-CTERM sorting domain-containing protein [Geomonas sp. RF6]
MKKITTTFILVLTFATNCFAVPTYHYDLTQPGGILYGTVDVSLNGSGAFFDIRSNMADGHFFLNSSIFNFNQTGGFVNNLTLLNEDGIYLNPSLYRIDYFTRPNRGNVSEFGSFNTQVNNIRGQAGDRIREITFQLGGNWTDAASVLFENTAGYAVSAHVWDGSRTFFIGDGQYLPPPTVPEPGTVFLLCGGLAFGWLYRKRRAAA